MTPERPLMRMPRRFGALLLVLVGCASSPDLTVESDLEPRRALEELARHFGENREPPPGEELVIVTNWRDLETDRTAGLLFPKSIRVRESLRIEVSPATEARSLVDVWVRTEERRPVGSQGLRWQRIATSEIRRESLLREIQDALGASFPDEDER